MSGERSLYTLYHSALRVAALTLALVLVFDSGLLFSSTRQISELAQLQTANVIGVYAGVSPNEVNQLTTRITELEGELAAKERLIAVNLANQPSANGFNPSTLLLATVLFILLTLIIINYALDYKRIKLLESMTSNSRTPQSV